MAANGKKLQELILQELVYLKDEIKEVRQTDIPNLKIDMATTKTQIEERTGRKATLITIVGSIVTLACSVAAAWLLK